MSQALVMALRRDHLRLLGDLHQGAKVERYQTSKQINMRVNIIIQFLLTKALLLCTSLGFLLVDNAYWHKFKMDEVDLQPLGYKCKQGSQQILPHIRTLLNKRY